MLSSGFFGCRFIEDLFSDLMWGKWFCYSLFEHLVRGRGNFGVNTDGRDTVFTIILYDNIWSEGLSSLLLSYGFNISSLPMSILFVLPTSPPSTPLPINEIEMFRYFIPKRGRYIKFLSYHCKDPGRVKVSRNILTDFSDNMKGSSVRSENETSQDEGNKGGATTRVLVKYYLWRTRVYSLRMSDKEPLGLDILYVAWRVTEYV